MGIQAIAAGVGAVSSIAGGFMQAQQQGYQAEIAKMNEKIAQENAARALDRSAKEQEIFDVTDTAATLGEQEAAQGASGLSLTGKSAIQTRASSRRLGRLDALNIRQAGDVEAYNYRTQAANFRAERNALEMSADAAIVGGFLGAAGSVANAYNTGGTSMMSGATATKRVPKPTPKPSGIVY